MFLTEILTQAQRDVVDLVLHASSVSDPPAGFTEVHRRQEAEVAVWRKRDKSPLHQLVAASRAVLDGHSRYKPK